MNQFILILQCILVLFLSSNTTTKDFIKSAGKALKTGAQQTDKAFKKAGEELSTAFNWEMNVKNNTPYLIYTAILYVDEKQQFAIGAKTAEWILTVATLPVGGGGGAAAEVGETVGTVAAREGAEAIATAAAREGTEAITTAAAREITETATTAAAREIAETATTTAAREGAESAATTGARAAARESTETAATTGARAATREGAESTAQKVGTEAAESTASKTAGLSKAERVLGQKLNVQQKAELNLQARYNKLFPRDTYKGGFSAWMEKNPQLLGDEIVKLGGTRPVTPAVEKQAMENLKRAWIAEDTTQSFDQWANPQRLAKEIENVQAGKVFSAKIPGEVAETGGQAATKPIAEAPAAATKPLAEAPAAAPKTPTLQAAPKQPLPGSQKPIQVAASKTEPAPVLQETRALITSSPRKVAAESAETGAKTVSDIPAAPSSLPEIKPTTPQVNKPSAVQLQEVKLKPAIKQQPKPQSAQDLLRETLAKRRTAFVPEEEIDEPIEVVTRATTSKTTPSASPVAEAPGTVPAPPPVPEAPIAKAPVVRPTQEELASRIGQGLRRVEPTAAPKPAAAKTTSLEDILKGAFAKVPAN